MDAAFVFFLVIANTSTVDSAHATLGQNTILLTVEIAMLEVQVVDAFMSETR